jgi:hypothetical protein
MNNTMRQGIPVNELLAAHRVSAFCMGTVEFMSRLFSPMMQVVGAGTQRRRKQ